MTSKAYDNLKTYLTYATGAQISTYIAMYHLSRIERVRAKLRLEGEVLDNAGFGRVSDLDSFTEHSRLISEENRENPKLSSLSLISLPIPLVWHRQRECT